MIRFCIACLLALLAGCRVAPAIRTQAAEVVGNLDAGKPATLNTTTTQAEIDLPANSVITTTKTEATPTSPATEVRRIETPQPAKLTELVTTVNADTGIVDQSVAIRRADNEERRILLYAAIAAAISGAIVRSMLPAWPSLARGLWIGAGLSGAAWKFSDVPWWASLLALAAAGLLIAGYKRAEWDANKNGIPDILESK